MVDCGLSVLGLVSDYTLRTNYWNPSPFVSCHDEDVENKRIILTSSLGFPLILICIPTNRVTRFNFYTLTKLVIK